MSHLPGLNKIPVVHVAVCSALIVTIALVAFVQEKARQHGSRYDG
jgi:hypothetical protein